ncbi:hypothetical protein H4R33_001091 [Dimargaris cristalligena]|uniref:Thioredoxin-like protein n=1 Tax=Dimargaris cristalligena TaxID=215637 RepID=A0A4P9ZXB1_9FUNG|nr:hypothetical protein H4R33_001091 [Dimargaris cristalligena]RKP38335.1 thioredoxin-like protein [Dimargaris cristalligena]|eukprot:RKP38335.1 thioredoxin-like protein [Dimargaris cristalligena]
MSDPLEDLIRNMSSAPDETAQEQRRKQLDQDLTSDEDDHDSAEAEPSLYTRELTDGPQTGPKGVLADYRHFKAIQQQYQRQPRSQPPPREPTRGAESADDSEFDDLLDDEVLQQYSQQRLAEWQANQKTFGTVEEVAADSYATTVDQEAPTVRVVVHVYDDSVAVCRHLNEMLSGLARTLPHIRFIKIQAWETGQSTFTPDVLPILLAYQDGLLIDTVIRAADQLPTGHFTATDVANLLQK